MRLLGDLLEVPKAEAIDGVLLGFGQRGLEGDVSALEHAQRDGDDDVCAVKGLVLALDVDLISVEDNARDGRAGADVQTLGQVVVDARVASVDDVIRLEVRANSIGKGGDINARSGRIEVVEQPKNFFPASFPAAGLLPLA